MNPHHLARMECKVLELVLPWLTAQELATVARVSKSMAMAVKKVTITRTDDAAQGQERWTVPIINEVDNCLYPCFKYTKHSFVPSPLHGKSRVAWGSVTACVSGVPLGSPFHGRSKVQETAQDERQGRRLPDYIDPAVGCKCLGTCGQPGSLVPPSFKDAKLASVSTSGHEVCSGGRVTRKRKAIEERNNHCHGRGRSPDRCCENLMSERAAAGTLGPCLCAKMLDGQLAYDADSKLRVLTTAWKVEASLNCSRSSEQLIGNDLDSDSEDGSDVEGGPPLILECGSACSCSSNCGLRVSQYGLAVRVSIVRHPLKGWCLHAGSNIAVGSFVCEYAGEMITTTEAKLRQRLYETRAEAGKQKHGPSLLVLKEHLPSGTVCLRLNVDGTDIGNVARFISHSCDGGNLYPCLIRSSGSIVPRLGLFARRNIKDGEELSYNYGTDATKGAAYRLCFCGTTACRGMLPSEAT